MLSSRALLLPASLLASACLGGVGDSGTDVVDDNTDNTDDNADDNVDGNDDDNTGGTYPSWQLEDVQPDSPSFGDVYGLDAFAGKPLVVSLLLGF